MSQGRGGRSSWRSREATQEDTRGKYIEVRERIQLFYDKYPEGRLESMIVQAPDGGFGSRIEALAEIVRPTFSYEGGVRQPKGEKKVTRAIGVLVVRGLAYRTPDDPRPGVGHSMLMLPGETPYTEGSELENAETSAWGRAIAAVGIGITAGIASAQEVRNKSGGGGDAGDTGDEERAMAEYAAWVASGGQSAPQPPTDATPGAPAPLESTAAPSAKESNGLVLDGDGKMVGLTLPGFLARVAGGVRRGDAEITVSSLIVSRTAKALFGDNTGGVGRLTDEQRLQLWGSIEEVLTADTGD